MGGDGVFGWRLIDRCSDGDLHGRGPDRCSLQGGRKPSLDISILHHDKFNGIGLQPHLKTCALDFFLWICGFKTEICFLKILFFLISSLISLLSVYKL